MSKNKTSFAQTLENLRHGTVAEEIDELLTDFLKQYLKIGKSLIVSLRDQAPKVLRVAA